MEVILREHVDNLGRRGEVVKVADGYARNYLLPRKLALPVDRGQQEADRARARRSPRSREPRSRRPPRRSPRGSAQLEIEIARRVGETDALYGSVTIADIAEALAAKGFEVDRRKIQLAEPIKALGEYDGAGQAAPRRDRAGEGEGRRRRQRLDSSSVDRQAEVTAASKLVVSRSVVLRSTRFLFIPPHANSPWPRSPLAERTLPHNLEAEQSVLGAILHPQRRVQPRRRGDRRAAISSATRTAASSTRWSTLSERGDADRSRHAEGGAGARPASSTRSAGRPTSPRSSTACRARPTSSTTRGSSRRRRRCAA